MFTYLFKQIEEADSAIEFNIKCSFMEIYMEKIQDLLDRMFLYWNADLMYSEEE
jgi:hypothetical protein